MKRTISILLLVLIFIISVNAQDFKPLKLTYLDNPSPGYLFLTPYLSKMFFLLDNSGDTIYNKNMGRYLEIFNPKLHNNGLISFFSEQKYFLMNKNFEIIDSFKCIGDYELDFHDFVYFEDGSVILIGIEKKFIDLSQIISGGNSNALVIGNIIQKIDNNKNLVFHWSSLEHFQITDVTTDIDLTQPSIISCHMNSIIEDTDGNLIISSRTLDEITKIDGKTGEFIWRLGGKECKNNQFRYLNDTIDDFYGFSHQHSLTRLPNGNLLLFDNGNLKPKLYSRAVEYKLDETNKTIEKVWEYSAFPEINSQAMGNVQRLPNGNTLIGWGINSPVVTATEVKPDGTKALEFDGYQNYSVYKYVFRMHAVTLDVDNTGNYDFNKDTNITNVKIQINELNGEGNVSVAEHFYKPHNLEFPPPLLQPEISNSRWVVSKNGIIEIKGTIRFYINYDSANDVKDYYIFCREYEGKGSFSQLETRYDNKEKCFEADIKGSGEFIIGMVPAVYAPMALYPLDSAKDIEINSSIMWQPMSMSSNYRFQLSNYPDFNSILIDSSNIVNTWLEFNFNYNTTYYWRVKAFFYDKQSPWSKAFLFTTRPEDFLSSPALIYPPDNDSLTPVTGKLEWEKVNEAEYYNVDIALDTSFVNTVLKRFYIDTNQLEYNNFMPYKTHYWRVASSNSIQLSDWSAIWQFYTEPLLEVRNKDYSGNIEINQDNGKMIFKCNYAAMGKYLLCIFDLRGNKIIESSGDAARLTDNTIELDISSLYSGYYFFRILLGNNIEFGKIIVD